jgi:hypothetical protein
MPPKLPEHVVGDATGAAVAWNDSMWVLVITMVSSSGDRG